MRIHFLGPGRFFEVGLEPESMAGFESLIKSLSSIVEEIESDPNSPIFHHQVPFIYEQPVASNQFLMFLKPESICKAFIDGPERVLEFVFNTLDDYRMRIRGVFVLSAPYLKKFDVIAQHYGVINRLSRSAREHLSVPARSVFLERFGESVEDCVVLGGHEFSEKYSVDAKCLDLLWANLERERLASGTYCAKVKTPEGEVYLVNGFHPWQLRHYTEPGRCIISLVLDGELHWKTARRDLIGTTNPQKAKPKSIRGQLLARQKELGLATVDQSLNGVHLSAGPLEALIELRRFSHHLEKGPPPIESFEFGKRLLARFGPRVTNVLLTNPLVPTPQGELSLFDLSEEMDAECAVEAIAQFQDRF